MRRGRPVRLNIKTGMSRRSPSSIRDFVMGQAERLAVLATDAAKVKDEL
jgi:hypothetical protein